MLLSRLTLTNFRNYRSLDLQLSPGLVVLQGGNGQGKSNLLEAIYLLAIARSHRAANDRELVHWQAAQEDGFAVLAAEVQRKAGQVNLRVGLRCTKRWEATHGNPHGGLYVQKQIRINGIPRLASALVGHFTATLFTAEDINLVHGAPALRRRYLDVLLSQVDQHYLRGLQKYQHVLAQRNSLLRLLKGGRARPDELEFWDQELCQEGAWILEQRLRAIQRLWTFARDAYASLTGAGHCLELSYQGTVQHSIGADSGALLQAFHRGLEGSRPREMAVGATVVGPHRDDLRLWEDGVDLSLYASRGQARAVALAMRLAEGQYLQEQRGEEPVLLLDDVFSELDSQRRRRVLEHVLSFQQVLVTTTDVVPFDMATMAQATCFQVYSGTVVSGPGSEGSES